MRGVQLPPGPLIDKCPGGPARSGRHSLKVKSVGSNPIQGTETFVSAGHRRAQVAVTQPQALCRFNSCPTHCTNGLVAQPAEQDSLKVEVQGSTPCGATGRLMGVSSNGKTVGLHPANEGSTPSTVHCSRMARWWNRQTRGPQKAVPTEA